MHAHPGLGALTATGTHRQSQHVLAALWVNDRVYRPVGHLASRTFTTIASMNIAASQKFRGQLRCPVCSDLDGFEVVMAGVVW